MPYHSLVQSVDFLNETFRLFEQGSLNGISNLNPSLTINGQTVTPTLLYYGGAANSTNWVPQGGYGATLTLQAGTAPSYNQGSPLLGSNDDSVKFNTGGYYQASDNTVGQIGTEDIVFEIVYRPNTDTSEVFLATRTNSIGYQVYQDTNERILIAINDGTGTVAVTTAVSSLVYNTWYHAICFMDRSGSGIWYLNGVAQTAAVISARASSLTSTNIMTLGTLTDGTSPSSCHIAYLALWKQPSWLDTHLQATVALERFNRCIGIYPRVAKGTIQPTVQTRATVAYLDKIESDVRKLYQVGASWLRQCDRDDLNGNNIKGYLSEVAVTNRCLQSENLSLTWTVLDVGDTIGGSVVAPNKVTQTGAGIIADSTNGDHGVTQNVTLTAATYTFSCFAKAGNKNWLYLSDDTVANCTCYFDLSTAALGTIGAGATGYIEDWGNGWCRCCIRFTGTAAAHTFKIQPADANGDKSTIGDSSTVNTYVWGCQVEVEDYMSSYIPTTTVIAARNADVLTYKGDNGNLGGIGSELRGTVTCSILIEDYNNLWYNYVWALSDGGSGTDVVGLAGSPDDNIDLSSAATGGNAGASTITDDTFDGVTKVIRGRWETNSLVVSVDGIDGSLDTSVDIPNDLDQIDVGMAQNNQYQLNGLISNIKIYKRATRK